jgi:hypothetical protein
MQTSIWYNREIVYVVMTIDSVSLCAAVAIDLGVHGLGYLMRRHTGSFEVVDFEETGAQSTRKSTPLFLSLVP